MDWTQLRKLVEKKRRVKHSGRNGRPRYGRRLANQTYAYLYEHTDQSIDKDTGFVRKIEGAQPERIEIELFEKPILYYYPDGSFEVNNHDYWNSPTTKERFRRFLPGRGYISSWGFDSFTRPEQHTPVRWKVWTMSLIGGGCHPWKNEVHYDALGHRGDLAQEINEVNANELLIKLRALAKQSIVELNEGSMSYDNDCPYCEAFCKESVYDPPLVVQKHLFQHVMEFTPTLRMIRAAARFFGDEKSRLAVHLMVKENQIVWKRKLSRSKRATAERVERMLSDPSLSGLDMYPTHYNRMLRWQLEKYLLTVFGFEIGNR